MNRAPFQVLVIPYYLIKDVSVEYAVFLRNQERGGFWQGISGGGQDRETPLEAAKREAFEEAGIPPTASFLALDSMHTIPVEGVQGFLWGEEVLVIPEYCFAVSVVTKDIILSDEHVEFRWTDYETALGLLKWESNRNALWELNYRLSKQYKFIETN
jgi:dATP pyrophosphohydrolase